MPEEPYLPENCDFDRCRDGWHPCNVHPIPGWTGALRMEESLAAPELPPMPDPLERLKWPGWR